jgi:hypothetical protein
MTVLSKPIVGTFGPILFGVANPSDVDTLDDLIDDLRVLHRTICEVGDEKWRQYAKATDQQIKDSLWSEYDELAKEAQIVSAWLDAARVARIFAEKGFQSEFLGGVQYIPVVQDDALADIDL